MIRPGVMVDAYHNYGNLRLCHNGYVWRKVGFGFWKRGEKIGKGRSAVTTFYGAPMSAHYTR